MRRVAVAFGAAVAAALATMPLAAQQRRVLQGTALDANGNALAGAEVRFVYIARGAECGEPTDDRRVQTDTAGAYRVELLPCAPYRVWCLGKPAADGTRSASALRLVDSSPQLTLHARGLSRPRALRVEGLAAWAAAGPFHVRVMPAGMQLADATVPLLDGRASIAALPLVDKPTAPAVVLQLLDRDGQVLATWQPEPDSSEWRWQLEPPAELDVRMVDNQGIAVAGAELLELTGSIELQYSGLTTAPPMRLDWRSLGRTDTGGWIRAVAPTRSRPAWQVRAPNGAVMTTTTVWDRDRFTHRAGDVETLRIPNPTSCSVTVVTTDLDLAGQRVLFASTGDTRVSLRTNGRGATTVNMVGAVALAAAPDTAWLQLLPPELRSRSATPPVAFSILLDGYRAHKLKPRWLLQLEITKASGGAPTDAQVALGSNGFLSPWSWHAIPDHAGRVAVVATDDDWLVFAHDADSACARRIDKLPDGPIRLVLQPLPRLLGKVVDATGAPVANAQLESVQSTRREQLLPGIDPGLERVALWRNKEAIARCRTAADGSFECRFVADPGERWFVRFRRGERVSATFELEAEDGLVTTIR